MQHRWSAVTTLADQSRRTLYNYVRRQDHPVTREEAADATGMSRKLAAFHLDKLVRAGLLCARDQVLVGRPRGRGRSPKVYQPAVDALAVTIPERRYELVAGILADAVAGDPANADTAARRQARQRGREVGRDRAGEGTDLVAVLRELGYEPSAEPPGRLVLHNCPFHALATRHTELICGINHALVTGVIEGLGAAGVEARLVPRPGACCVELLTVAGWPGRRTPPGPAG